MRKLLPPIGWGLLLSAVACLASRAVPAVPVTEYITVQPIDDCAAETVCSRINNLGFGMDRWFNAPVGAVGFITTSGINVARAIWNQIGIDVTYMPATGFV